LPNSIYRYALLETARTTITTTPSPTPHPGLLQTCQQIREEATDIYYEENKFPVPVWCFDTRTLLKWIAPSPSKRMYYAIGSPCKHQPQLGCRPKLLAWLQVHFEEKICGPGVSIEPEADRSQRRFVRPLFNMVKHLREKGRAWEEIEYNLQAALTAMSAQKNAWK
jgi:hypothetical protein